MITSIEAGFISSFFSGLSKVIKKLSNGTKEKLDREPASIEVIM